MRILVIEDDLEAQRYLVNGLKEAGHVVDDAADGDTGLTLALSRPYDVAIVDRMLPKMDGLDVVAEMREHSNATPVLFLSALSEVDDRVKGLKAGGDDYLTKPYAFVELLARIDALMRRRSPSSVKTRLQVGDLELDLLTGAMARQSISSRANSACSNTSCAMPARSSPAPCCSKACGNITSIRRPT
jgi:two-component system OmpR family response regulator